MTHGVLEAGVVGEALEAIGEGVRVADGDDEAFDAIDEEVLAAGVGGTEDGAAAGHGLGLNEGESFLDAGKREDMAAAHERGELGLRDGSEELDVFLRQARKDGADVFLDRADEAEQLARVAEASEGLKQVRDAFAETDCAGEEDLEGVGQRIGGGVETFEANAVGDDVELLARDAHLGEGASGHGGGDGDGVTGGVDGFFAAGVAWVGGRRVDAPAAELVGEDLLLVALVGGTAVADEDAALALDESAGAKAGAGDADEGVDRTVAAEAACDPGVRPAVEGDGVGVTERVSEPGEIDGGAAGEVLGDVEPGEGLDLFPGKTFALEACPGPAGVDAAQMTAAVKFAGEFKVMVDAEDGLDDLHEFGARALLSLARSGARIRRRSGSG